MVTLFKPIQIKILSQIHLKRYINNILQHTAPNIGVFESLLSSSSVPNMNPINVSPAITQNSTVPSVAMKKSAKNFDELDHQYKPEEDLHQTAAHMIFTRGEQLLDPVVYD